AKLKLATLSYQDLADHGFADSIRATAYFNRQNDGRAEIRVATPGIHNLASEVDNMKGFNLELGTFLGRSNHVLYGIDATAETVHSKAHDINHAPGVSTVVRGRYTDGAKYSTLGIYLQDRWNLGRWLTTSAGVRWGRFRSSGDESSSLGVISVDARNSDFT